MNVICTVGFTKKTAEEFFNLLIKNNIQLLLDIRLNNTSQLAAFSKYPDIEFFLKEICDIKYIHDKHFSPTEQLLTAYKKKEIDWNEYVNQFTTTMNDRQIIKYIEKNYILQQNICLLCSEDKANNCHRSLVADIFSQNFNYKTKHL